MIIRACATYGPVGHRAGGNGPCPARFTCRDRRARGRRAPSSRAPRRRSRRHGSARSVAATSNGWNRFSRLAAAAAEAKPPSARGQARPQRTGPPQHHHQRRPRAAANQQTMNTRHPRPRSSGFTGAAGRPSSRRQPSPLAPTQSSAAPEPATRPSVGSGPARWSGTRRTQRAGGQARTRARPSHMSGTAGEPAAPRHVGERGQQADADRDHQHEPSRGAQPGRRQAADRAQRARPSSPISRSWPVGVSDIVAGLLANRGRAAP